MGSEIASPLFLVVASLARGVSLGAKRSRPTPLAGTRFLRLGRISSSMLPSAAVMSFDVSKLPGVSGTDLSSRFQL